MTNEEKYAFQTLRRFLKEWKIVGEFISCTYRKNPQVFFENLSYVREKIKRHGKYTDIFGCFFTFVETKDPIKWEGLWRVYQKSLRELREKENSVLNGRE